MRKKGLLLAFLVSAAFVYGCAAMELPPTVAEDGGKIRVLVLKGVYDLSIEDSTDGSFEMKLNDNGMARMSGRRAPMPLTLVPSGELLRLNGRSYRGTLEVTSGDEGFMVINELPLETYLAGVINAEISSKWHEEVLKAQAVIARTYAVNQRAQKEAALYHIEGTILGQVYTGAGAEDAQSLKAVQATRGEIVAYRGEPALTVYHSNAGGMTDAARDIWTRDYPYLLSVESPYDSAYPKYSWEYAIEAVDLKKLLISAGHAIGTPAEIVVEETTPAGRVKRLLIKDSNGKSARLTGEKLRGVLGYGNLRSTKFSIEEFGTRFIFKGNGSGHGVGLSQWGAKGMAENGYGYKEILRHYYPYTDLLKYY